MFFGIHALRRLLLGAQVIFGMHDLEDTLSGHLYVRCEAEDFLCTSGIGEPVSC